MVCGRHNSPCCGDGEGTVAGLNLGDRPMTLFVFPPTAAWARVIPSDLRRLAILQEATVEEIPDHFRATRNRDCQRDRVRFRWDRRRNAHAAIDLESPHGQLQFVLTPRAFVIRKCPRQNLPKRAPFQPKASARKIPRLRWRTTTQWRNSHFRDGLRNTGMPAPSQSSRKALPMACAQMESPCRRLRFVSSPQLPLELRVLFQSRWNQLRQNLRRICIFRAERKDGHQVGFEF